MFAVAAVVLCAAGLAKLRSPSGAVSALMVTGLPARRGFVHALAIAELVIGALSLLKPSPLIAAAVAVLYAGFCSVSFGARAPPRFVRLLRRPRCARLVLQSALSAALCLVDRRPIAPAHGIGSILDAGAAQASALIVGIAGAAYATIAAYTELPQAFAAWSSS